LSHTHEGKAKTVLNANAEIGVPLVLTSASPEIGVGAPQDMLAAVADDVNATANVSALAKRTFSFRIMG
jgi:hypothetical protein